MKQQHRTVSVILPVALKAWLEALAVKERRSLSAQIVHLLEQAREKK